MQTSWTRIPVQGIPMFFGDFLSSLWNCEFCEYFTGETERESVGRERQSRDKVTESLPPCRHPSEPYKWGGISPGTYLCVFGKFGSPRDVLVEWKHQMNKLLCFAPSSCRNGPLEPSALTSDNMLCIQTRTLNTKVASVGPAACLLSRSPHFV